MTHATNCTYIPFAKTKAGMLVLWLALLSPSLWADCGASAIAVVFGNYDVFSAVHLDSTGRIDVACTPGADYTIALSTGNGSYGQREMLSGAIVLDYNLYTNASRTTIWGDGSGVTSNVGGSGVSASHTVYGRVPALQNKPAGSYADTIVVTVTY